MKSLSSQVNRTEEYYIWNERKLCKTTLMLQFRVAAKCMNSSGLFIWGYYYSWNLKLNLSHLVAIVRECNYPRFASRTTNEENKIKKNMRRKIDTVEVNVSAFYSLVFQCLNRRFFLYAVVYEWKGISTLNSIDTQTIDDEIQQWRNFYPNCVLKWMSVIWIWCSGAFHSAIFIGSFHRLSRNGEMRRQTSARRCTKSNIFDEFNGRNLADFLPFLLAVRVHVNVFYCWPNEKACVSKCRNSRKPAFYARTWVKLKLIFNKCKLSSNFVCMTCGEMV